LPDHLNLKTVTSIYGLDEIALDKLA